MSVCERECVCVRECVCGESECGRERVSMGERE